MSGGGRKLSFDMRVFGFLFSGIGRGVINVLV